MKFNVIVGIGVALALAACEKNNNATDTEPEKKNYYPMEDGSFWVYNTYEIDSLGNEELISENDTVEVIGDSIVNGMVFKRVLQKQYVFFQNKEVFFIRDSAGYIIDTSSSIVLTFNPDGSIFREDHFPSEDKSNISFYYMMEKVEGNYSHYLSSYNNVIKRKLMVKYHYEDGAPVKFLYNIYAPGIGQLVGQYSLTGQLLIEGKYYERRLVDYYIPQ